MTKEWDVQTYQFSKGSANFVAFGESVASELNRLSGNGWDLHTIEGLGTHLVVAVLYRELTADVVSEPSANEVPAAVRAEELAIIEADTEFGGKGLPQRNDLAEEEVGLSIDDLQQLHLDELIDDDDIHDTPTHTPDFSAFDDESPEDWAGIED